MHHNCILCHNKNAFHFHSDTTRFEKFRDYFHCRDCGVVFVRPDQRLEPGEEFKRYEMHENHPDDPDYRKFLRQLFDPMAERIKPESDGLDFGSGPGPTLSVMFEEEGHRLELFDIFYANRPKVFEKDYDFITTSETAEHLFHPREELDLLWDCLKPEGWLGIMTQLYSDLESFKNWHYKNDDTHVVFYSRLTFEWFGKRWRAEPEYFGSNVVLFQKPG